MNSFISNWNTDKTIEYTSSVLNIVMVI